MKIAIGQRLKEERERLNHSQPQMAELINVTLQTLSAWESGETVPDACNLALLKKVGVDTNYLITGEKTLSNQQAINIYSEIFKTIDATLQANNLNLSAQRKQDAANVIYKEHCANGTNIQTMVNVLISSK